MNEQELKETVISLLNQVAPDMDASALGETVNFRQELGMDSFDTLQFIVALSEKLQVNIPEQDYGKITTLQSLVAYLSEKTRGQ